jgi:hypothetical protein
MIIDLSAYLKIILPIIITIKQASDWCNILAKASTRYLPSVGVILIHKHAPDDLKGVTKHLAKGGPS